MSDENKNVENKQEENQNRNKIIKIFILILVFIFIIFLCKYGYSKYQILDFQKRYKEAPPGSIIKTGNMKKARSEHCNIKLINGSVLVVGGNTGAEIFDPKTGQYKLINNELENISFNVHNYFVLKNGNILIANKYLFDVKKYKFIDLHQDNSLYNNLSLSGYSPSISNVFALDKDKLIFPILNQYNEININCYDKLLNLVKECKCELSKYLFPLNKVFYLNNGKYLILVSFDPNEYRKNYDKTKILQEPVSVSFILYDKNSNTFKNINFQNILSYNVQTALLDEKNIWIVDNNSNLCSISSDDFTISIKDKISGNFYFARLYKIDTNTLLIVSPLYTKPSILNFIYFDINKNKIIKTVEVKYRNLQSQDFRIRKSYDLLKLENNDFLINGGQSGTHSAITKTNESYILKQ